MNLDTTVTASISVPASQRCAFETFTKQWTDFKPPEHNVLTAPLLAVLLTPYVGGTITDIGEDGSTCSWARVVRWEPPAGLSFTWDISPGWVVQIDRARASDVHVDFVSLGARDCAVSLTHQNLNRHGEGWEVLAEQLRSGLGWSIYLSRFADLLE